MANERILVVENEASLDRTLRKFLESSRYDVVEARTSEDAKRLWREAHPDIAILDEILPGGNGIELLDALRRIDSSIPVVILAAHSSRELAKETMSASAEEFLAKPVDFAALGLALERILENQRDQQRHLAENRRERRNTVDPFVGTSSAIRSLAEMATQLAASDVPVLIQGETGTGKGTLARWIHQNGTRAAQPFVDLQCGGSSPNLLETELFGHQRTALSGGLQSTRGLLELAHRGTVFLDEVRDLNWQAQPKLMKALDKGNFVRVGDDLERKVDVRLILATRYDLQTGVRQGQFHDDLYTRITTFTLTIPSLRDRSEDIPYIANRLLTKLTQEIGGGTRGLSEEAMRALRAYSWPGNIRELRNALERAVLLSPNRVLTERDFNFEPRHDSAAANTPDKTLDQVERQYIQAVLNQEGGRVEVAAKKLGIPRSSLYYKLKQYGLRRTGTTLSQHT